MSKPRVTIAFLKAQIANINRITNSPTEPYIKQGDTFVAQIGCYHLSQQYGGYSLVRITNEGGGTIYVLGCGHVSARELSERLVAYLRGLYDGQKIEK